MACYSVTSVLGITSMKALAFLTAGQVVSDDSQAWSFRVSQCWGMFTSNHDRSMFTCTCMINWDRIIGSYKGLRFEVYYWIVSLGSYHWIESCRIIRIKD